MLTKRVTMTIDDDLIKKLHDRQAKLIKEFVKSVSFSVVVHETLRKHLK